MKNDFTGNTVAEVAFAFSFEVEHIWGGAAGDWRHCMVNLGEMEIMLFAKKAKPRG